eukprot:Nk52_evm27s2402 gene=Nk52_evmTU27s2402
MPSTYNAQAMSNNAGDMNHSFSVTSSPPPDEHQPNCQVKLYENRDCVHLSSEINKKTVEQNGGSSSDDDTLQASTNGHKDDRKVSPSSVMILNQQGAMEGSPKESLQLAFQKFRRARMREIRNQKLLEEKKALQCSPERIANLRQEFLDRAIGYLGVPYAKRYHQPGSGYYNSPLFLDCCGLVRQVLYDMSSTLGFRVGPWNQAYQFDTLPISVSSVNELKPGDLIFYSGTYFSEKKKAQKHDMVHVEIYVGGRKTLGARWGKGRVQVHDDFEFESTSYHSVQHHFRSIDTWLKGECNSHCSEHSWKLPQGGERSAKSIFNARMDTIELDVDMDDDYDHSLCPEDLEGGAGGQCESEEPISETSKTPETPTSSTSVTNTPTPPGSANGSCATQSSPAHITSTLIKGTKDSGSSLQIRLTPGKKESKAANANDIKEGTKIEQEAKDRPQPLIKPQKQLPEWNSSTSTHQSVPNLFRRRSSVMESLCPSYYISSTNGAALIIDALDNLGWRKCPEREAANAKLKWVPLASTSEFVYFREGEQMLNHIQKLAPLTSKIGMLELFRGFEKGQKRYRKIAVSTFLPETYRLDLEADRQEFMRVFHNDDCKTVWICKPTSGNQGKGIYLVENLTQVQEDIDMIEKSEREKAPRTAYRNCKIIQRYIHNPLLIKGRKFDIRVYMLIASANPFLALYHKGYCRLSVDHFCSDISNKAAHLTNQYIQKKHPKYDEMKEDTVWTMEQFQDYLIGSGARVHPAWVSTVLKRKIQEIMKTFFEAIKSKISRSRGTFQLLGFDIMIDESFNVWLIEINVNPALHTNCENLKKVIPPLVTSTINVVTEVFQKTRKGKPIGELTNQAGFEILYSEEEIMKRNAEPKQPNLVSVARANARNLSSSRLNTKTSTYGTESSAKLATTDENAESKKATGQQYVKQKSSPQKAEPESIKSVDAPTIPKSKDPSPSANNNHPKKPLKTENEASNPPTNSENVNSTKTSQVKNPKPVTISTEQVQEPKAAAKPQENDPAMFPMEIDKYLEEIRAQIKESEAQEEKTDVLINEALQQLNKTNPENNFEQSTTDSSKEQTTTETENSKENIEPSPDIPLHPSKQPQGNSVKQLPSVTTGKPQRVQAPSKPSQKAVHASLKNSPYNASQPILNRTLQSTSNLKDDSAKNKPVPTTAIKFPKNNEEDADSKGRAAGGSFTSALSKGLSIFRRRSTVTVLSSKPTIENGASDKGTSASSANSTALKTKA